MEEFTRFIRSTVWMEEPDLQLVLSRFNERTVPKGNFVLRRGHIANQYFFVVSGGVRFSYEEEDKEITSWVVFKDEFFTEISSMHLQKPSRFNIEAVEDSRLLIIDKRDMDFLYAHVPAWEEFGRKNWEAISVRMIDQILNFQTLSAGQRYLELVNSQELVRKIPVKQLAAILGITPNALSRIRKRIS